ncbi:Uncharacterized protein QTN25_005955 [Entamoeba marina]
MQTTCKYKCLCGNTTITVDSICEQSDLHLSHPPCNWDSPICSTSAVISHKYDDLWTTKPSEEFSNYTVDHCTLCDVDVCMYIKTSNTSTTTEVIINPMLRGTDKQRESMIYSETYGLWLKDGEIGEESIHLCSDSSEKLFFQLRQEALDSLFNEKERIIREFVLMQEELFEMKRSEVKKHFLLLKNQCSKIKSSESFDLQHSCSPSPTKSIPLSFSNPSPPVLEPSDNVFFFDEETQDNDTPPTTSFLHKKQDDLRTFHPINKSTLNTSVNELDTNVFPATFRDFTLEKYQHVDGPLSHSCVSRKTLL